MTKLTEGGLDRIMNGIEVEEPIFQILGHKKLASSTSGERYRLLLSDGIKSNSYSMLATQLNDLIANNILSEYSIVKINRYAISMVNNGGAQKRVMVILNLEVLVPGNEVGKVLESINEHKGKTDENIAASSTSFKSHINQNEASKQAPELNNAPAKHLNTILSNGNGVTVNHIADLSPYQNRWVIKARVTNKSTIRTWSNSRGEGKLFSMDLLDDSGEIRCTAFRDQCDKFYDMIEIGKVYYISRCQLKPANKQFNNLKNDYEMTLSNDSEIVLCNEETDEIPTLQYDFVAIGTVENKKKDELIDILGIVKTCSDVQTVIQRSTSRELNKRDIGIVDENNDLISVTLWGTQAVNFDGSTNPVVAIKGAKIGEFNGGKNLTLVVSSMLQVNPDIPQAHKLQDWYKTIGKKQEFRSLSTTSSSGTSGMNGTWLSLKEVLEHRYGHPNMPNTFITKATIQMIKGENVVYKACPSEGCKKKLLDQSNGMYKCEKCRSDFTQFDYRLIANINIADHTNHQWITAFNEEAEIILKATAQELGELKESDNDAYIEKITATSFKSYIFKLRVKLENYNDENRLKVSVVAVQPIYSQSAGENYNQHLLDRIKFLIDTNN